VKRVTLGFGSGASELKTLVKGYQMTASGPRFEFALALQQHLLKGEEE
jgi:hypothetical protein